MYILIDCAIEIFTSKGKSYLISVYEKKLQINLIEKLEKKIKKNNLNA
jgi:hypothetical protein